MGTLASASKGTSHDIFELDLVRRIPHLLTQSPYNLRIPKVCNKTSSISNMKTVLVFAFAVIAATNAASAGAPKINPGDEFASTKVQKIMRLAKKFAPLIPAKVFLA